MCVHVLMILDEIVAEVENINRNFIFTWKTAVRLTKAQGH